MKKLRNTEAELKERVAYEKKCIIILNLSFMVCHLHQKNVCEFTTRVLIIINMRKNMKNHSICIYKLFMQFKIIENE